MDASGVNRTLSDLTEKQSDGSTKESGVADYTKNLAAEEPRTDSQPEPAKSVWLGLSCDQCRIPHTTVEVVFFPKVDNSSISTDLAARVLDLIIKGRNPWQENEIHSAGNPGESGSVTWVWPL